MPVEAISAFAGVPDAHVPPVVTLESVVAEPVHTSIVPVMADGSALTVMIEVV